MQESQDPAFLREQAARCRRLAASITDETTAATLRRIDALIGLIPGIGDVVTTVLSSYIIWEARNLGVSRFALARMIGNLGIHATIGSIPVAGDLFDAFFRVAKLFSAFEAAARGPWNSAA